MTSKWSMGSQTRELSTTDDLLHVVLDSYLDCCALVDGWHHLHHLGHDRRMGNDTVSLCHPLHKSSLIAS